MTSQTLLAFAAIATLAIASPGPAVLLSLRNGATLGPRSVTWSALGNICGVCCLSIAAICGLGVVLESSAMLFGVVKLAGALYLFYVGIRHLRSTKPMAPVQTDSEVNTAATPFQLYREGFLIAITNPKAVLFFTALFPQFIDAQASVLPQFLVLTGIFMTISYASHLGYGLVASRARGVLVRPFFATWLNRIVGVVFVSFGVLLLAFRRQAI